MNTQISVSQLCGSKIFCRATIMLVALTWSCLAFGGEIHDAAKDGDLSRVKALIASGADVNAKNGDGATALFIAAYSGHLDVAQALLAGGAQVNAKSNGATPLMGASLKGYLEIAQALMDAKADVNATADRSGATALMYASQGGHVEIVKALLSAKADVNARHSGGTALLYASQVSNLQMVQLLVGAGADVNAKKDDGRTALIAASQNGSIEIVRALLRAKADVNAKQQPKGLTALMQAAINNHLDVLTALLEANADVNAKAENGGTALIAAAYSGHPEVVRALIDAKADVSAQQNDGVTALIAASGQGEQAIVQLLKSADSTSLASPGTNPINPDNTAKTQTSDQVWTDPDTKLMWAAKDSGPYEPPSYGLLTHDQAIAYAKDCQLAGFHDWRLPTIKELEQIYDKSVEGYHVKGGIIKPNGDPTGRTHYVYAAMNVWSQSLRPEQGNFWEFNFGYGSRSSTVGGAGIARALCVRGNLAKVAPAAPAVTDMSKYVFADGITIPSGPSSPGGGVFLTTVLPSPWDRVHCSRQDIAV